MYPEREKIKNSHKPVLSGHSLPSQYFPTLCDMYLVVTSIKGAVSRNSAKLGNYKMPVKLGET